MKNKFVVFFLLFTNYILAKNVLVVVMDGARYTETFGAGNTYIPHMNDELKPLGTLYTNFRIDYNAGAKTETNPGHASIATGTWQTISNLGGEYPDKPTIFEYFRKEIDALESANYMLAGKNKLEYIKHSEFDGFGAAFQATWSGNDNKIDQQVYDLTIFAISTDHPRLMIINFPEVDYVAHNTSVINNYTNAITNADNCIYQLWQCIQNGDYGYNTSNTTMFITNDHGRHDGDLWGSHGDGCEGCTHIMLLALGRNVFQGIVNNDIHYQVDIAPTVGDLLGFSTSEATGTSLFQGSNPLPVEHVSFSAIVFENIVKLKWRTDMEVNNYGFEVFRQTHTSTSLNVTDWEKIGFVNGNGNSNSPKSYSFIDENLPAGRQGVAKGKYSYRLKQIDNDGQFEYSSVVKVDLGSSAKYSLEQNYPNPFNPGTTVRFSIPVTGNVKIELFDMLGQEVQTLIDETKEAGTHSIEINTQNLNSGIYIYKIESGSFVRVRKMMFLK